MPKDEPQNDVKILLRLPQSLARRLAAQAKAEETTMTSHMVRLLATAGAAIDAEAKSQVA
jgi:branched-subunit amino acid aminotransferase/4-amino-4-deoxychorismate lyase